MRIMVQIYWWQAAQGPMVRAREPLSQLELEPQGGPETRQQPWKYFRSRRASAFLARPRWTVDGKVVAVHKRAGFLTNCREMRDELSVVCVTSRISMGLC